MITLFWIFYGLVGAGVAINLGLNRDEDSWPTTILLMVVFGVFWPVLLGSNIAANQPD